MKDAIERAYQILEVDPQCSLSELKQSRKELTQIWHPDRFAYNDKLQEKALRKTQEINSAYDLITKFHKEHRNFNTTSAKKGTERNSNTMEVEGRNSKQIPAPLIPLKVRIGLILGFGLLLIALLVSLSNRLFESTQVPASPYHQLQLKKSVEIRDETYLIRQQMSRRMREKIDGYLRQALGNNRSSSQIRLELDPQSSMVLLAQVTISLDGEGKYDRDSKGVPIGTFHYTDCSQSFLHRIETSVQQILRLTPSRGDRVEVNCFDFSQLVKR